jgi:hypothetical protein
MRISAVLQAQIFLTVCSILTTTISDGFVLPTTTKSSSRSPTNTVNVAVRFPTACLDSTSMNSDTDINTDTDTDTDRDGNAAMRKDIEQMKQEALARLDALKDKFHQAQDDYLPLQLQTPTSTPTLTTTRRQEESSVRVVTITSDPPSLSSIPTPKDEMMELKAMETFTQQTGLEARMEATASSSSSASAAAVPDITSLLDSTRWKLMLNVGREQGTWMPKTWGISGERLLMNLEMEFSPELMYEREDFLNGVSGAKLLKVVHNELTLTPSMKEGSRRIRVKNGGWRVALGEGPLGTDVLRFYLELQEQARHEGSDVYCPAARIYCTCGYFPMANRNRGRSLKDTLRQEQEALTRKYEALAQENELDTSLVSFDKIKRSQEMMQLRMQANKLNQKIMQARTKEPEKALLRLDQKQQVGLTRVGGICCKVQKGMAVEYHILGKFELASTSHREHADYRDLLP